ncbi:MAG: hypothetical protein ACRD3W_04730, partial [Terriglobales bacterium]
MATHPTDSYHHANDYVAKDISLASSLHLSQEALLYLKPSAGFRNNETLADYLDFSPSPYQQAVSLAGNDNTPFMAADNGDGSSGGTPGDQGGTLKTFDPTQSIEQLILSGAVQPDNNSKLA